MQSRNIKSNIGIGVIGCGVIAESHIDGLLRMPYIFNTSPAIPKLVKICEINKDRAKDAADRYGFMEYCTDWHEAIQDERIEIIYNTTPNNLHAEICIAAAKNKKHIVCEKPLARNAAEAKAMLDAAKQAKVKNLCDFILRMVPALAFAKQMIMQGKLGKVISFNASRLMDNYVDPKAPVEWRSKKGISGSGVIGDVFSHIADLARWFCGEPVSVMASSRIYTDKRPSFAGSLKLEKVDVEDDSVSILEFENGATGYLSASRIRAGRKAFGEVEVNGELGSIYWSFEEMNRLYVYLKSDEVDKVQGFHQVDVNGSVYPYVDKWHYSSFMLGFNDVFINNAYTVINSVVNDINPEPMAATFEDGYKVAAICDAVLKSSESGKKEKINY